MVICKTLERTSDAVPDDWRKLPIESLSSGQDSKLDGCFVSFLFLLPCTSSHRQEMWGWKLTIHAN